MFAISTSDYAISRGSRCSSPCSTDEDRLMFRKNQINKRRIIEEELQKIPENERNNLTILMKCLYSNYVEQLIEVKIVKEEEKCIFLKILNSKNDSSLACDRFHVYSSNYSADTIIYPEIWKNFDNRPFIKDNDSTIQNKIVQNKIIQNKIYLLVPYSEKEDAKKMNAKWDNNIKKWYILNNNKNKNLILQKWKVYIK
jgi:hypothetical protein